VALVANLQRPRHYEISAFALAAGEEVSCYYCILDRENVTYRRGEAVLADAGHPPYDGNANYICLNHLDRTTVIYDPHEDFRSFTVEEYKSLGDKQCP
jgi:hypothetical protein